MGFASLLEDEGAIEAGQVKEVAEGILRDAQDLEAMITNFLLHGGAEDHPGEIVVAEAHGWTCSLRASQ